jgi:hypothetical protein
VRVLNAGGASVHARLDASSERRLARSARASIGPLAAGTYVIELHGLREPLRQEIRLVDRDGRAGFSDALR